jgi:hypothetical protein
VIRGAINHVKLKGSESRIIGSAPYLQQSVKTSRIPPKDNFGIVNIDTDVYFVKKGRDLVKYSYKTQKSDVLARNVILRYCENQKGNNNYFQNLALSVNNNRKLVFITLNGYFVYDTLTTDSHQAIIEMTDRVRTLCAGVLEETIFIGCRRFPGEYQLGQPIDFLYVADLDAPEGTVKYQNIAMHCAYNVVSWKNNSVLSISEGNLIRTTLGKGKSSGISTVHTQLTTAGDSNPGWQFEFENF